MIPAHINHFSASISRIETLLKALQSVDYFWPHFGFSCDPSATEESHKYRLFTSIDNPVQYIGYGATLTEACEEMRDKLLKRLANIRDENQNKVDICDKALEPYKKDILG